MTIIPADDETAIFDPEKTANAEDMAALLAQPVQNKIEIIPTGTPTKASYDITGDEQEATQFARYLVDEVQKNSTGKLTVQVKEMMSKGEARDEIEEAKAGKKTDEQIKKEAAAGVKGGEEPEQVHHSPHHVHTIVTFNSENGVPPEALASIVDTQEFKGKKIGTPEPGEVQKNVASLGPKVTTYHLGRDLKERQEAFATHRKYGPLPEEERIALTLGGNGYATIGDFGLKEQGGRDKAKNFQRALLRHKISSNRHESEGHYWIEVPAFDPEKLKELGDQAPATVADRNKEIANEVNRYNTLGAAHGALIAKYDGFGR